MLPGPPPEPPRDADGLRICSASELSVSRALTWIASLAFFAAAAWELFGPLLAGHYASSASVGISAENMLRWGLVGPVLDYAATPPGPGSIYCHHPWGIFWTTLPFVALFGHEEFVCRLPPVLLSAATPWLLFATVRAIWRPAAGAAAAVAFVVLPITLSFASFNALEVPVIAWGLVATWGFVRHAQTSKRRYLLASTIGAVLAMNADWPAFVLVGAMLGFGLLLLPLRRPGGFGAVDAQAYVRWWLLWATAGLLTVAGYLLVFRHVGALDDLLASYGLRSKGQELPLREVLAQRRYWIELAFTPIAIALGKVALPVVVGRLVYLRREAEFVPLAWLTMATVQYVVFKQGADVHFFWPHYFAAYFALGMGALVATVIPAVEWVRGGRSMRLVGTTRAWATVLAVVLLPMLAILRDGLPALAYARGTGGRFSERGLLIDSDGAATAFLSFVDARISPAGRVRMHEGMKTTWSQQWALRGREVKAREPVPEGPATEGQDVYLLDTRFASDETQMDLARRFHVEAVGPFWMIDPRADPAPITASSIEEREPTLLEWYFVSGTEPRREITPDPFLTWELRTHFGQPATPPSEAPRTFEQRRIAHNIAMASGDAVRAAALEAALVAELTPLRVRFENGSEIVGVRHQDGVQPTLTLLLRAGGPLPAGVRLSVRSKVLAPARFSTTMADPVEREVAAPLPISLQRARAGFLYALTMPIRKRPGTEVFHARLQKGVFGAGPKRLEGDGPVEVLRLD